MGINMVITPLVGINPLILLGDMNGSGEMDIFPVYIYISHVTIVTIVATTTYPLKSGTAPLSSHV